MSSYLRDGKILQGVQLNEDYSLVHFDQASKVDSYFSEESPPSSADVRYEGNQCRRSIVLRKLGLNSHQFAAQLSKNGIDYHTVTDLDASYNHISTLLSKSVSSFTNLTELNLSFNSLAIIPSEIYLSLGKLTRLVLSENQIEAIPDVMPLYQGQLQELFLDGNSIRLLPSTINEWKKLRKLILGSELGGNLLQQLPDTLSDMHALEELNVSFNQLTDLSPFPDQTRYINLSHNKIKNLSSSSLRYCSKLCALDLSDNLINDMSHTMVTNMINLDCLDLLNLNNNQIFILPTELLEQTKMQVMIKGNPLTQFNHNWREEEEESNNCSFSRIIRDMIHQPFVVSDYSPMGYDGFVNFKNNSHNAYFRQSNNDISNIGENESEPMPLVPTSVLLPDREEDGLQRSSNNYLSEEVDCGGSIASNDSSDGKCTSTTLLHSLREIALRALMSSQNKHNNAQALPERVIGYFDEQESGLCALCQQLFAHEWISSVRLKSYHGHPSVVRKIRFCSVKCWDSYKNEIGEKLLQLTDPIQQRQEALDYIEQQENGIEHGSIEWIMAAVQAAQAQEEQHNLLAMQ